jgi:hypothetical protein
MVAADYGFSGLWFYLPPAIRVCVCVCLFVTDDNWNFSAVRSSIEVKFGEDLGLVSQISVPILVSTFIVYLYFVNKQKPVRCNFF